MDVRRAVLAQLRAAVAAPENSDAYEDAHWELWQLCPNFGLRNYRQMLDICRAIERKTAAPCCEEVLEIVAVTLGFEPCDMRKGGDL